MITVLIIMIMIMMVIKIIIMEVMNMIQRMSLCRMMVVATIKIKKI